MLAERLRQKLDRVVPGIVRHLEIERPARFCLLLHEFCRSFSNAEHQLRILGIGRLALGVARFAVADVVTVLFGAAAIDVPLADVGGRVTERLECFGNRRVFRRQTAHRRRFEVREVGILALGTVGYLRRAGVAKVSVAAEEVACGRLARLETTTRWRAHSGGRVGVAERHSLLCQPGNIRCVAE